MTIQAGAIYGGVSVGDAAGGTWVPPRQLPMPTAVFVNRATELATLDASPPAPVRARPLHVICGGPGTGKTALAVHWAENANRFPDGHLYVDMRGYGPGRAVTAGEVLDMFLRALHVPPDDIPRGLDQRTSVYRSVTAGKRLLVLIDNVSTAEHVRPLLPGTRSCRVVATSRSILSGLVVREGATRLMVGELSIEDSLALLREIVGDTKVDANLVAARRVIELCGHLPLALRIVAEREARSAEPDLAGAVEALADEQGRLDALDDPDDELSSVRAAFGYSYRRLGSEAARVFRLLGVHPGPSIALPAVAALAGLEPARARRLIELLVTANLVDVIARDRYRLHDLLRLFAAERARHDDDRQVVRAALRRVSLWYLHSVDAAQRTVLPHIRTPELTDLPAPDPLPDLRTVDEAMRWFEAERENLLAALDAATSDGQHDISWQLPLAMYALFELRNYWDQWPEIHRVGIDAAAAAGDQSGVALNHLGLADALWLLHDTDAAMASYQLCADVSQRIGNDWALGSATRQIGRLLRERGQHRQAVAMFHQALEVFARSGERRGQAITMLALAEHESAGNLDAAIDLCRTALDVMQSEDDRWTIGWLELALGQNLLESQEFSEAMDRCRHAASIFAEFGDEIAEVEALLGVAEALVALGRHAELDPSLTRIDDVLRRRTGPATAQLAERRAALGLLTE